MVSHKCTLGVFVPGESPTGCLSQLTESDLPSLQRRNRSRKQRERQRSQAQTAGRQHRGDHQEGPEVNTPARQRAAEPPREGRDQLSAGTACPFSSNLKQFEGYISPRLGALLGELVSK